MVKNTDSPEDAEVDLSDYLDKQKYPISILDQYWLLQKRELTATFRGTAAIAFRIVRGLILAFLLCTLFFQLSHDQVKQKTYFYLSLFLTFLSLFRPIPLTEKVLCSLLSFISPLPLSLPSLKPLWYVLRNLHPPSSP